MGFKKVTVMGLGYIGLPTASLLATKGFDVLGVDIRPDVVATINHGHIHISEPDLDLLVRAAVQSGKLRADTEPQPADVFIIAVPTPFKDNHAPDLSYVEAATRSIASQVAAGDLVILESTSPVGTTEKLASWIAEERPDLSAGDLQVAHCPERVLPGQIIRELVDNDRIVGGIDDASTQRAAAFYQSFVAGAVLTTSARTAELAKLTENTFRDVNIALANELSLICDRLAINVWELIALANRHPRVNILSPGPGVGGHCIAVDPWFIVDSAPQQSRLIRTAREVNDAKPGYVVEQIRQQATAFKNPVIACLGLTYKANIDDLRESPALAIVEALASAGTGRILVVEPNIEALPISLRSCDARLVELPDAMAQADILVALVDHHQFRRVPDSELADKTLIDAKGIWCESARG